MSAHKRTKRAFTQKAKRAVCGCTAQNGDPKTLYSQKFLATKAAGATMERGKMWQIYKCPEGQGFHIATVRWDPWSRFESNSRRRQAEDT